ncbi:MAG: TIGR04282 family arsenosugar biosynthesis glycosyltransferase [Cyanobacteria bacterium J06606_4]
MTLNPDVCRLLLFLRYPQPGHTKTRLIPALGADGAARLQRQMSEYLLGQICRPDWSVEIYFTGGSLAEMQAWLGKRLVYRPQIEGDLGARLCAGFRASFRAEDRQSGCAAPSSQPRIRREGVSSRRVVAIGSDCPDVSAVHIRQAFRALAHKDVVLGPAQDGGYYLIGLRHLQVGLFQNIDWSTPVVFQQTYEKVLQSELSVSTLPVLSDIDRPADLAIWERIQRLSVKAAAFHL